MSGINERIGALCAARMAGGSYLFIPSRSRWRGDRCAGRSLQPLSPIQNNSDLAQGPLPIRPSKVRCSILHTREDSDGQVDPCC